MKTLWKYAALLTLALISTSCENEKDGLIDPPVRSPFLASAQISPARVNLDSLGGNGTVAGTRYRLRFLVEGSVVAAGGSPIQQVTYQVFAPGESSPVARGSLRTTSGGDTTTFRDSVAVTVGRNDIGAYTVAVSAKNTDGTPSGSRHLSFVVTRRNTAPSLSQLSAPDTIDRPETGIEIYTLTVAVADSDGYSDIQDVSFKRTLPTEVGPFPLFDDGDIPLHGDRVAGDGVFSVIIKIDSSARLADQWFLFQARDRSGAVSDSLTHRITITP